MKITDTLQGEKLWGTGEEKSQGTGTPEKHLRKIFFGQSKQFLFQRFLKWAILVEGSVLWEIPFC